VLGRRGSLSTADVRIVTASSQHLEQFVRDGRFNRELFQRLNGIQIKVPTLQQRKSDIPALVDQFMRDIARSRTEPVRTITPDALARLMQYDWPGNVRELESTIAHAVPLAAEGCIGMADLPPFPEPAETEQAPPLIPGATIQEIEREAIVRTLEYVGGSTTRAARTLNMSVRKIQYKLKEYRLTAAVRSETHRAVPSEKPFPKKRAVFIGGVDSAD
jgi:DNA-binding NtrC family response regulator